MTLNEMTRVRMSFARLGACLLLFVARGNSASHSNGAAEDSGGSYLTFSEEEYAKLTVAQWQSSVDALLADVPNFQSSLSLMMSGLVSE